MHRGSVWTSGLPRQANRQVGKTIRVVSVPPVIPAAPVAQTLPAVTVDRSGQSFFLTAMVPPYEIVAASLVNSGDWVGVAESAGASKSYQPSKFCQLSTAGVKLCGL